MAPSRGRGPVAVLARDGRHPEAGSRPVSSDEDGSPLTIRRLLAPGFRYLANGRGEESRPAPAVIRPVPGMVGHYPRNARKSSARLARIPVFDCGVPWPLFVHMSLLVSGPIGLTAEFPWRAVVSG